jgi:hypothetical protein
MSRNDPRDPALKVVYPRGLNEALVLKEALLEGGEL